MATKNIFELLPDSDPETETHQDDKKPVKTDKKKEKNTAPSGQAQAKPKEGKASAPREEKPAGERAAYPKKRPAGGYNVEYLPKADENKGEHKHEKSGREGPKPFKGVPAEPHPLDRRSGTGRGKEVSKSGAGRRNWGTPEDDVKENRAEKIDEKEAITEQVNEEAQEVEVKEPEQLTLEEYYRQKNIKHEVKEEPKEIKKKIDYTQGKIQGLEIVKGKDDVVEKAKQPKAQTKEASHKLVLNSENSDLLGFQTGLQTFAPRQPKKPLPPKQEKPEKHGEEAQPQATEKQPEEEGAAEQQPEGEEHQDGRRGGRGGRRGGGRGGRRGGGRGEGGYRGGEGRGEGGYRGGEGRGEGGYRGGEGRGEGGYRGDRGAEGGYRGPPREGAKKKDVALNFEDDRDFPSLG